MLSHTFCPLAHQGLSSDCFCAALLSAWVAIILLSPNCLMCCSASGLSNPSTYIGVAGGSRLINSWLGASLVVELAELLYTNVARGRRLLHSLLFAATNWRNCSSHWFFCLVSLSIWGWNAVDIFHVMPSSLARAYPKWLVKWGSLSDITFVGSPN